MGPRGSRVLEIYELAEDDLPTPRGTMDAVWDEEQVKKWELVQELAGKLLGEAGKAAVGALVPQPPKQPAAQEAKDPVQVRKSFQQAVLAKEKAEAAKAKADREVQKLQEELQAAKNVQMQVKETLEKAEQRAQQALEDCNRYIGKEEVGPPTVEPYQGEDPELQQMQKDIANMAQEQARLLEEARARFADLLAKRSGQGGKQVLAQEAAQQGQRAAKQARRQAEGKEEEAPDDMELGG